MKTSNKILLGTGLFIAAAFTTGMLLLQRDVKQIVEQMERQSGFQDIQTGDFHGLDIAPGWSVRVKKGSTLKVSISGVASSKGKVWRNRAGVLSLASIPTDSVSPTPAIARIRMPHLYTLKAAEASSIHLEDFEKDSIEVKLLDGSSFIGKNNKFKHASFVTHGQVRLQFVDSAKF